MEKRVALVLLGLVSTTAVGCGSTTVISRAPQGADVCIDGERIGETPTSYDFNNMFRNSYDVKFRLRGCHSEIEHVTRRAYTWGNTSWQTRCSGRSITVETG